MTEVPKDPLSTEEHKKYYVIWVVYTGTRYSGDEWKIFQIAATKEFDDNDNPQLNAYLAGNYKKGVSLTGD